MSKKTGLLQYPWLLALLAGSGFSFLVLFGLYRYARTLVPLTKHESQTGVVVVWALWGVLVSMPVVTALWAVVWLLRRRD